MPAEEIAFRVASEGPLTEFTRRNPGVLISLWCDWRREVAQVVGAPRQEIERLKRVLGERSSFLEHYPLDAGGDVLVLDCLNLPHDIVNEAVDATRCLHLPPTRFEERWEHYRVVSFGEEKSRELLHAIRSSGREVELLSKRRLEVQPLLNTPGAAAPALLAGLTDKQVEALLLAARHGMYQSPRRTTAASLADSLALSRSTFEEHVRKAEHRLVANLLPYLELEAKARRAAAAAGASAQTP